MAFQLDVGDFCKLSHRRALERLSIATILFETAYSGKLLSRSNTCGFRSYSGAKLTALSCLWTCYPGPFSAKVLELHTCDTWLLHRKSLTNSSIQIHWFVLFSSFYFTWLQRALSKGEEINLARLRLIYSTFAIHRVSDQSSLLSPSWRKGPIGIKIRRQSAEFSGLSVLCYNETMPFILFLKPQVTPLIKEGSLISLFSCHWWNHDPQNSETREPAYTEVPTNRAFLRWGAIEMRGFNPTGYIIRWFSPPKIFRSSIRVAVIHLPPISFRYLFFFKMLFKSFLTASFVAASALAAPSIARIPTQTLEKRATSICGQWDAAVSGTYTLYQDLWGESSATSGSQCSTPNSLSGNTISWSTSWTWAGGSNSVKSYANVVVTQSTGYELSAISSIPTVWDYS